MHVMRELRGAASIVAMHAVGLTPLQAVLASPAPPPRSGPPWAEHLGWKGPFESAEPLRARESEPRTSTTRYWPRTSTSSMSKSDELVDLIAWIRDTIDI